MVTIINDFNIKAYNTFGINAKCAAWIEYTDAEDIPAIMRDIKTSKYRSIGQGSNMLFINDYDGTLLHSRILDVETEFDSNGVNMKIGSGVCLDDIISQACASGLWGIENLSGIPGDIGAAAVQNVGAYGVEIKDVIRKVECYDTVTEKFTCFSVDDCDYGYRYSMFKSPELSGRYIITYVTIGLKTTEAPNLDYGNLRRQFENENNVTPQRVRESVLEIRNSKLPDPANTGSAGSFFKNPIVEHELFNEICSKNPNLQVPHYIVGDKIKIPAAWLIEQCGWKGRTLGNAGVWPLQPLVLINATGNATGKEIEHLEKLIIKDVESKFGITLYPEVDHIY